ncbi:hypothetical protein EDD11_003974, partial [Mortierella claussenii]
MQSLQFPSNDATQRLEQAFQLIFQSNDKEYAQLCGTFKPLGGLPRAWIIKGDSGVGKTYLAKALCKKYQIPYTATITIGELAVMYPGDLLKGLKAYLGSIQPHAKAVVVLDNIELVFPREESDFALVYLFQSWIQGLIEQEDETLLLSQQPTCRNATSDIRPTKRRVMVLGLTQDVRGLDPSVFSLFDDSIELDIPTPEERYLILKTCALNHGLSLQLQQQQQQRDQPLLADQIHNTINTISSTLDPLELVSLKCHGYLAADLDALCIRAAIQANQIGGRGVDQLTTEDFLEAMRTIRVSALRQSTSVQKVDPVHWSDIGGLEGVKRNQLFGFTSMQRHMSGWGSVLPRAFYCKYGPPGTGKTLLAKAVATESEANFMAVSIPDLIKGEVGESEKALAKVFKMATRCSPCVVFLDELEAIFGSRESSGGLGKQLISQLLLEMDNCGDGVVILAATNHPEAIDTSILRP